MAQRMAANNAGAVPLSPTASSAIQVVVRLRPMNENEKRHGTLPVLTASTQDKTVTVIKGQGSRQVRSSFNFDHVFTAFSSQEEVFEGTIKPVISDVLKGFESTVFAYGQTGTGKTHTMEGNLSSPEMHGVIPRSSQALFEALRQPKYSEFKVTCSYLEIYNEDLCDLLADEVSRSGGDKRINHGAPKLEIMEGKSGTFCRGLVEKEVNCPEDVLRLMQQAQQEKKIGETKMNKHSSRSHCIFTIRVRAKAKVMDGTMEFKGKLHLVDLAGSECAKTAGLDKAVSSEAARERERMNINRSLLTLGRVISLLKQQSESKKPSACRIPYRDSKLTRILQEALGGRCKTVIVATLSPSITAIDESLSTLNYAQSANGIVNKPVATSYMSASNPTSSVAASVSNENSSVEFGSTIEHWHEMECRLAYMHAQVSEAQAALARKHMQQQELVEKAEQAERERLLIETKLDSTTNELNSLKDELSLEVRKRESIENQLSQTQNTLIKTKAILTATQLTEAKLTAEAKSLFSSLQASMGEADSFHNMIIEQKKAELDQKSASKEFNISVCNLLRSCIETLDSVKSQVASTRNDVTEISNTTSRHGEEILSENERNIVEIKESLDVITTTLRSHMNGSEGVHAVSKAMSRDISSDVQSLSETVAGGEKQLSESCIKLRTQLNKSAEILQTATAEFETCVKRTYSGLDNSAKTVKKRVEDLANAVSSRIENVKQSQAEARLEMEKCLSEWKMKALKDAGDINNCTSKRDDILSKLLRESPVNMQAYDSTLGSLSDLRRFFSETGDLRLKDMSSQLARLSAQRASFESAKQRQRSLRDKGIKKILECVGNVLQTQMEMMGKEEEDNFQTFHDKNAILEECNGKLETDLREMVSYAEHAGKSVSEQVSTTKERCSRILDVVSGTKDDLGAVSEMVGILETDVNSSHKKTNTPLSKLTEFDTNANDIQSALRGEGSASVRVIDENVKSNRANVSDLFKSGKDMSSFCTDDLISTTLSSLTSLEEPRAMLMEDFKGGVDKTSARLSSFMSTIDDIAEIHKEQTNSIEVFMNSKVNDYRNISGPARRAKIKSLSEQLRTNLEDFETQIVSQLDNCSAETTSAKDSVDGFITKVIKADEEVRSAPGREDVKVVESLSSTPSEDTILRGLDLRDPNNMPHVDSDNAQGRPGNENEKKGRYSGVGGDKSTLKVDTVPAPVLQERCQNLLVENLTSSALPLKGSLSKAPRNSSTKRAVTRKSANTPTEARKKARVTSTPTRNSLKKSGSKKNLKQVSI